MDELISAFVKILKEFVLYQLIADVLAAKWRICVSLEGLCTDRNLHGVVMSVKFHIVTNTNFDVSEFCHPDVINQHKTIEPWYLLRI